MLISDFLPVELSRKRLIGLGEVTHGSGGLHKMAADLMEQMIVDFGVRTILFEAPYSATERINFLIESQQVIQPEDMRDLYFNWRSREILSFFNRLSTFNREGKKVRFIGIDIRQPATDLVRIRALSEDLQDFPVEIATVQSFAAYERAILDNQVKLSKELAQRLTKKLDELETTHHDDNSIRVSVRRLKFWLRTYGHLSVANEYDQGFLARDEGMASVVEHYLTDEGRPTIIWAHLAHLVYESQRIISKHSWFSVGDLLGTILRKKLGASYALMALMARETEVALQDGSRGAFVAATHSLEAFGPTATDLPLILGPDHFEKLGAFTIGATSNENSTTKQTYINMVVNKTEQFEYAAISKASNGLVDVLIDSPTGVKR